MTGFTPHLPLEIQCRHCRYSTGRLGGTLWCERISRIVVFACREYERAPGADDELGQNAPAREPQKAVKTRAAP